ncbi:MAG: cyclic nucleotide-binding domain-containing protein [Treponema sp.]|jgi:Na+/H+ antiporter NhaC|nr:cyclic nucleotide-binding domain-containing protein [Treponema sp.]
MSQTITREYIRNFFKLGNTPSDVRILDYVMSHIVLKEYPHNTYICRAGDSARAMYFIESGMAFARGNKNQVLNELQAGSYFGEYAALTGDKRMVDIQANGTVQVYELSTKVLHALTRSQPKIYGQFLKSIYDQASDRYQNLVRLLNARRGLGSGAAAKSQSGLVLFINYYLVFLVFFNLILFIPDLAAWASHPLWLCSPIVFLVFYIVITRRALESIFLSGLYISIMQSRMGFIGDYLDRITTALGDNASLVLIVMLMGALTRQFSASGSINALKFVAEKRIKTGRGILFSAFCSMVFISIDEYLSILINGACFTPLSDQKKLPREKSAFVLGMTPMALCILNPLSLTGLYLTGVIVSAGGGQELFLQAIRYNFSALFALAVILFLILGILPPVGALKKGLRRVREGGDLWPEGTSIDQGRDSQNRGKVMNLVLPILVLIGSSIVSGSLETGSLSVNVLYGMLITLIFTFILYCSQRYMSPEQFFNNLIFGFESMLAPVVMFIASSIFASGIEEIGFSAWLDQTVRSSVGGQAWILPALIFAVCTLVGALFDNPWAMYALGMPIALELGRSVGMDLGLFVGAVCAAGFAGNEIALGDIFFEGPMLGINPIMYYRTKLPYAICVTMLAFLAYGGMGYFLRA